MKRSRKLAPRLAGYVPIFVLALHAAPALAASVLATAALEPPAGGTIKCSISNASAKKPITVEWTLYDAAGVARFGPLTTVVEPFRIVWVNAGAPFTSSCVARVLKGGKKSLRLALYAEDASGNIVAAVTGN